MDDDDDVVFWPRLTTLQSKKLKINQYLILALPSKDTMKETFSHFDKKLKKICGENILITADLMNIKSKSK